MTQAPTPEGESTYSESTSGDAAALPRPRKIRSGGDCRRIEASESPSGGAALSPSKSNSPVPHPRRSDTGALNMAIMKKWFVRLRFLSAGKPLRAPKGR